MNGQSSLIPSPICVGNCPQNVACTDVLSSDCVYYNGATLTCISDPTSAGRQVQNGDSLTTVLNAINNSYGVRVSASDICCGYLDTKIMSSNPAQLGVSVQTLSGCQVLVLTPASGSTQTCVAKVSANGSDSCDYLINKVESTDSSLTIAYDGSAGKVNLTNPCAGKVFVSNSDPTCNYLSNKLGANGIYPTVITVGGQQQVIFSRETYFLRFGPLGTIPLSGVDGNLIDGTNQNLNFNTQTNTFQVGANAPSYSTTGSFAYSIVINEPGYYDVSMLINIRNAGDAAFGAGYLIYGLEYNGGDILMQESLTTTSAQTAIGSTGFIKSFPMNSGDILTPKILNRISSIAATNSESSWAFGLEKTANL